MFLHAKRFHVAEAQQYLLGRSATRLSQALFGQVIVEVGVRAFVDLVPFGPMHVPATGLAASETPPGFPASMRIDLCEGGSRGIDEGEVAYIRPAVEVSNPVRHRSDDPLREAVRADQVAIDAVQRSPRWRIPSQTRA